MNRRFLIALVLSAVSLGPLASGRAAPAKEKPAAPAKPKPDPSKPVPREPRWVCIGTKTNKSQDYNLADYSKQTASGGEGSLTAEEAWQLGDMKAPQIQQGQMEWKFKTSIDELVAGKELEVEATLRDTSGNGAVRGWVAFQNDANTPWSLWGPGAVFFEFPVIIGKTMSLQGKATVPSGSKSWDRMLLRAVLHAQRCTIVYDRIYEWTAEDFTGYTPCPDAGVFYDKSTLQKIYKGGKGDALIYSREQIVAMFDKAVKDYEKDGGTLVESDANVEAPFLAAKFIMGSDPTGKEGALRSKAAQMHEATGKRLTPGDLFLCALRVCDGNVRDALVTCHACTYRSPEGNAFVAGHLAPLRNAEAYNPTDALVPNVKDKSQPFTYQGALGSDQTGLWYHLYGIAAVEYQDECGIASYSGIRLFADALGDENTYTGWAAQGVANLLGVSQFEGLKHYNPKDLPGDVGTRLVQFAIGLEENFRSRQRRPADPEKQCINFTGAAVGRELRRLARPKRGLEDFHIESDTVPLSPYYDPYKDAYVEILKGDFGKPKMTTVSSFSPVTLRLFGDKGQRFVLDQSRMQLSGNTLGVLSTPFSEVDGTWGSVTTALFPVTRIEFEVVRDGKITVAGYDHASKKQFYRTFDGKKGYVVTIGASASSAPENTGQTSPAAPEAKGFAGKWESTWGTIEFHIENGEMKGTFTHKGGRLTGKLSNDGRTLTGTWSQTPSHKPPKDAGPFEFALSADGKSFTGKWWYGYRPPDGSGGGEWKGNRGG